MLLSISYFDFMIFDAQTLSVEFFHVEQGKTELSDFMTARGYVNVNDFHLRPLKPEGDARNSLKVIK
jgi:hypothetical protein